MRRRSLTIRAGWFLVMAFAAKVCLVSQPSRCSVHTTERGTACPPFFCSCRRDCIIKEASRLVVFHHPHETFFTRMDVKDFCLFLLLMMMFNLNPVELLLSWYLLCIWWWPKIMHAFTSKCFWENMGFALGYGFLHHHNKIFFKTFGQQGLLSVLVDDDVPKSLKDYCLRSSIHK